MMPGKQNLDLYRGDSVEVPVNVLNADRTPADLTGVTPKAEIRDKSGGALLAAFVCTVTDNRIDLSLDAATCRTLPNKGVWDLQLTEPGGKVRTILCGTVKVTGDVTDSVPPGLRQLRAVP